MKRFLCVMLVAMAVVGCSKPRVIPDDKLSMIFHDAFLANAYANDKAIYGDSLDVYEPIFGRYGYTVADMQYTISSFSRRKSARLTDIVDAAVKVLEAEGKMLNRDVLILDTINNVARRTFSRELKRDSLIKISGFGDTSRLRVVIKDMKPGEYEVKFNYVVDSLDRNDDLRATVHIERTDDTQTGNYTIVLRNGMRGQFLRTFRADSTARRLIVRLGWSPTSMKRPRITYRNFSVRYTPPIEVAIDSLYYKQLDIKIFADEFFRTSPQDSLQSAVPAGGGSK